MKLVIAQYLEAEHLEPEARKYFEELLGRPADQCSAKQKRKVIKFELSDVEYTNNKYPDSFFIPPLEIRKSVELGMSVKVIADWLNYDDSDERFWVELKEECIDENGERLFFGESRNNTQVIKWGTKFGPIRLRNICDINFEAFENRNSKLVNA